MECFQPQRVCRSVELALVFSVLGCGGKAAESSPPLLEPPYMAPRARPASPPLASASQQPLPAPKPELQPQPASPNTKPMTITDYVDTSWTSAGNVLSAYCGYCHGPALTPAQAQAGINFIDDMDALVAAGLVVPLDSAASRIVVVMRNGSMPPPTSGYPQVTEADIQVVEAFIDNPRFWPDWPGLPPQALVDAGVEPPAFVDAGPDGG